MPLSLSYKREIQAVQRYTRRHLHTMTLSTAMVVANTIFAYAFSGSDPLRNYFSRSSDDDLDNALIAELKRIVQVLGINPGFKYIDDNNAFASESTIVEGTRGTVFLGLPLIRSLMQQSDGGIAVAGICAHECGHIYQIDHEIMRSENSVTIVELHADFIAGYYIGKRSGFTSDQIEAFSAAVYKFGQYSYSDPQFHGSPGQRTAAVEKGHRVAGEGTGVSDASKIGLSYVKNL
jgi:hypothetical protein